MKYKQTGTHVITPDLTLTDFTWQVIGHAFVIDEKDACITVKLDQYNTRDIIINVPVDFKEKTLCNSLLTLPAFAGSTPNP